MGNIVLKLYIKVISFVWSLARKELHTNKDSIKLYLSGGPATCEEISNELNIPARSVYNCLTEMSKAGSVYHNGCYRTSTRNREQKVWSTKHD